MMEFWIHIEHRPNKASWWMDGRVKEDFKVYSLNNCESGVDLDLSSSRAPPALKYVRQMKISSITEELERKVRIYSSHALK